MMAHKSEFISGEPITTSSSSWEYPEKRKLLLLLSFAFLFLVTAIAGVTLAAAGRRASAASHAVLHSACLSARYPSLCVSAVAASPSLARSLSSHKDVILASLHLTLAAVAGSSRHVSRLAAEGKNLTARERTALDDCLQTLDASVDELRLTEADLRAHPDGKPLRRQAGYMAVLVSAAMTNQESCLDGFSHDGADRRVRAELVAGLQYVTRMCCNALAMIGNLTADASINGRRRLGFEFVDREGFPEWMAKEDRRRLEEGEVKADAVVAADGSGDYRTIREAVAAAPALSSKRHVIRIKAGVYAENVEVPKKKTNLMFVGDGRKTTVITGCRNAVDGSTTFRSATLAVAGGGFLARGLRIENTAGPSKHQAVALRVNADLSAFYDCDIVGYQDTLYVHSLRQFYRSCLVAGTVDFIFGNAAAVLQDCDLQLRRPAPGQKNMVAASGREDANEPTGIAIHRSRIAAAPDLGPVRASFRSYLGRPWKEHARTVVMESEIGDVIDPAGWLEWDGVGVETLYYGEYRNTGAGAGTGGRVKWKGHRVIANASEAVHFTPGNFLGGSEWLGSTGFPFTLGLLPS